MLGRRLINRAVATFVAAGAGFVAMVALGATVYYLLLLALPPVAAAAVTSALFALVTLFVVLIFIRQAHGDDDEEEEDYQPEGLGARAFHLFQQRPVLGTVAALAGGWIFLRNPALATMVAAAFTEKSHSRRRR